MIQNVPSHATNDVIRRQALYRVDSTEFRAAIDLDRAHREGYAFDQFGEVIAGCPGGGTPADGEHRDAADDIDGGELAAFGAGTGAEMHCVELDEGTERGDGMVGIRMT